MHKTGCEVVGLPAPADFRMTVEAEIESEYFREEFMARNLADDEDDASVLPRTNYVSRCAFCCLCDKNTFL